MVASSCTGKSCDLWPKKPPKTKHSAFQNAKSIASCQAFASGVTSFIQQKELFTRLEITLNHKEGNGTLLCPNQLCRGIAFRRIRATVSACTELHYTD